MKNFFRLSRIKIVNTIILGVVNFGLAFYSSLALLCTENCPEPSFWQSFFGFTIFPFSVVLWFNEFFENFRLLPEVVMVTLTLLFSIIILVVFWYLLVCIINKVISLLRKG